MKLKSLFPLCNATPQRAVNARRQRKQFRDGPLEKLRGGGEGGVKNIRAREN